MGLGNGLVGLFKQWGKGIGNAADHVWLREEAQKAIRDEIEKKFQPKIDLARRAEGRRADNIKDLGDKITQSKKELADAQKSWQDKYNSELAGAKNQRQTEIADYDAKLKGYQDALDNANASRQSIIDQLSQQEASYNPTKTIYTDVISGDRYLVHPVTGEYKNITQIFKNASKTQKQQISRYIKGFDERLLDTSSGTPKVINAFDEATLKSYHTKNSIFDNYLDRVGAPKRIDLKNAKDQIKQAKDDLSTWKSNSNRPTDWDDQTDLVNFDTNFRANNAEPTGYSFNGKNYSDETALDTAYQKALNHAQYKRDYFRTKASNYASERDKEIAQRIQDAKDINKAKVALGLGTAGALAGATYAAFSGDDNSNTKPVSPTVTPQTTEGIETQFEHPAETDSISGISPRDQEAALADMAFKAASESDDTPAETHPETPELAELSADDIHTNEGIGTRRSMNEGLFSVIKALQDPHQANAVADYIYSRYGNDPELQQLGWRAWLNKYYGDALRSQMNLDASGYNGMHIA